MSVRQLLKPLTSEGHTCIRTPGKTGIYPENTGQVHIRRSSGQGQCYRNKKGRKCVFLRCKTSIAHNYGSITEPRCLRVARVFDCGGSNGDDDDDDET